MINHLKLHRQHSLVHVVILFDNVSDQFNGIKIGKEQTQNIQK